MKLIVILRPSRVNQVYSSWDMAGHGGVAINTENIHLKSDQISQKSSPTLCREVYFSLLKSIIALPYVYNVK